MITNEEFESRPWKVTSIGNYWVDYYVVHTNIHSNLFIRVRLKQPSFHSIDEDKAMAEVFKIKNYLIHEGYLDTEMDGTPPDAEVMIYSIYVYEKENLIQETRWDRFINWMKGLIYERCR